MKPHHKSEMLPYPGGKFVTFRAYVGEGFKDTDLDVQSVLARHYEEKKTAIQLTDFSVFSAEFCRFAITDQKRLTEKEKEKALDFRTYGGDQICTVADFFKWFFAPEVEAAILLDLEQEYKTELGERGEVEAEGWNDFYNCL